MYEYESQNKRRIKEFDEKTKKLEAEKQKLLNTPTKSRLRERDRMNYDCNPLSVDATDKIDASSSPHKSKEKGKSSFDSFKDLSNPHLEGSNNSKPKMEKVEENGKEEKKVTR